MTGVDRTLPPARVDHRQRTFIHLELVITLVGFAASERQHPLRCCVAHRHIRPTPALSCADHRGKLPCCAYCDPSAQPCRAGARSSPIGNLSCGSDQVSKSMSRLVTCARAYEDIG